MSRCHEGADLSPRCGDAVLTGRLKIFVLSLACAAALSSAESFGAPPSVLPVANSEAKSEAEMKPYTELIEHTDEKFDLVPIKGGKFRMGSPASEKGRKEDEGPQHEVTVEPFWMAKCEITWDVFEIWMADLDIIRRKLNELPETPRDKISEPFQISKPTKPYTCLLYTSPSPRD